MSVVLLFKSLFILFQSSFCACVLFIPLSFNIRGCVGGGFNSVLHFTHSLAGCPCVSVCMYICITPSCIYFQVCREKVVIGHEHTQKYESQLSSVLVYVLSVSVFVCVNVSRGPVFS